jgi:Protein of unknown function (DUF4235)
MTLIYKPIAVVLGLLAGFMGRKVFEQVWGVIDDEEPPKPNTQRATWVKVLTAAALEGLIFRAVRAAVERAGASGFYSLTGSWPGEKDPEPE